MKLPDYVSGQWQDGAGAGEPLVKEVVREMTLKAGQKCTAIRRVLVPRVAALSQTFCCSRAYELHGRPYEFVC
jgi:acyl-CoA reductase-like NAD-dependent aldehyde dehydrogenase